MSPGNLFDCLVNILKSEGKKKGNLRYNGPEKNSVDGSMGMCKKFKYFGVTC